MFVRLTGYAVDIRPLRVHVPVFPASYLSGVETITENRTVYHAFRTLFPGSRRGFRRALFRPT
jgi:hypothetical protein